MEGTTKSDSRKKGHLRYLKFDPKEKAVIAKYACEHGVAKAVKHFKGQELKKSTVRDWKTAYESQLKTKFINAKEGQTPSVDILDSKKRGRPPLLGVKLDHQVQDKILSLWAHQAAINSGVVISVARALLLKHNKALLSEFGGPLTLEKEWARQLLRRMGFSKRRVTSTSKITPSNFEESKRLYLIDIFSIVKMEEIPDSLIINWDQTSMKIVPAASWTMEKKGTKRIEVAAADDKRQITAVFACSLSGSFLPLQLIFKGTTQRCLPNTVKFPDGWHLTFSENHWSTETTMIDYVNHIILPFVSAKRKELHLSPTHPTLVIFDYFKGQCQPSVTKLLEENYIYYVLVPANCTDRLQPLDFVRINYS